LNKILPHSSELYLNSLLSKPQTFYTGFDPTSKSLHIGHLSLIIAAYFLSTENHLPIFVIGDKTAQIGDLTGKTSPKRVQLSKEELKLNALNFKHQLTKILKNVKKWDHSWNTQTFSESTIRFNSLFHSKNVDFAESLNSINTKNIVELEIFENQKFNCSVQQFLYPCHQAYDWLCLADQSNCYIQLAGQDQCGNVSIGQHLVHNKLGKYSYGIMTNLLTDMHGKKISKSSLENSIISNQSPSLGDPFKLYQYLMNTPDELAEKFLNCLTFYNENKISQILNSHLNNKSLKVAQKALSSFVIDVVHGKKVLAQIEKLVNILFILKQCNFERLHDDEKNIAIKYLPKAFYDPKKTIGENLEEIIDDKSLLNNYKDFRINSRSFQMDEKIDYENCILKLGKKNFIMLQEVGFENVAKRGKKVAG